MIWFGLVLLVLTPLSARFKLYCGGQFYWCRKPEDPEKTTDLTLNVFSVALSNLCL
jgi:hypothetical protein